MNPLVGRVTDRVCQVQIRVAVPDGWAEARPDDQSLEGGPALTHLVVEAVIDTGAMVSAIPASVLERLGCPSFGAVAFQSVLGPHDQGNQVVGSYAARVSIPDLVQLNWVRVLGVRLDTALLGMDVLEHLKLEVDGPGGTFRLSRP